MAWFGNPDNVRVVAGTYQFFQGSIPTAAGFEFLIESAQNPTDLSDPYYAQFNQENRFINFANNLGTAGAAMRWFHQDYGALTFEQTVRKAYDEIIGIQMAQAAGIDTEAAIQFIIGAQSFYQAVAQERVVQGGVPLDEATKIVALGSILNEAIKAGVGKYAEGVAELVADVTPDGTSDLLGTNIIENPGASFLLTSGQDFADAMGSFRNGPQNETDFKFTQASETVTATSLTLTPGDVLRDPSTGDNDLLQIAAQGATPLDLQALENIERIQIDVTDHMGFVISMASVKGAKVLDLEGTLRNESFLELANLEMTGITRVDGSGLIPASLGYGFFVSFQDGGDNLSRTLIGSPGRDTLAGSPTGDWILGGDGEDSLHGFGGNDIIRGGKGRDEIMTYDGVDRVVFEASAAENGEDFIPADLFESFNAGPNGDIADFTAFLHGPGVVLEVPTGTVGGTGVDATGANILVFDEDPAIDERSELEAYFSGGGGKLTIGANRDVVVILGVGHESVAWYVSTNAAGEVSVEDFASVVVLFGGVAVADFVPANFA